jgi:hypothetical protein
LGWGRLHCHQRKNLLNGDNAIPRQGFPSWRFAALRGIFTHKPIMLTKYKVEYAIPFSRHDQPHEHLTDDPVACEEFLTELLERGFKIKAVLHQGVVLPKVEFDKMIKTAAGMLSTNHICRSLGIDRVEAHHRFGSPA